jgi:hypothetical protein
MCRMQVENFSVLGGWICSFKNHQGLVHKKVAGESAAVDTSGFRDYQCYWKDMSHGTHKVQMSQSTTTIAS